MRPFVLTGTPGWTLSPKKLKRLSSYNGKIGKTDSLKKELRSSTGNLNGDSAQRR